MPKYYCDYCDTYLTHDSPSVRKTHCNGRKHKENVRVYYQKWLEEQVQKLVDDTTAAFKAGSDKPQRNPAPAPAPNPTGPPAAPAPPHPAPQPGPMPMPMQMMGPPQGHMGPMLPGGPRLLCITPGRDMTPKGNPMLGMRPPMGPQMGGPMGGPMGPMMGPMGPMMRPPLMAGPPKMLPKK